MYEGLGNDSVGADAICRRILVNFGIEAKLVWCCVGGLKPPAIKLSRTEADSWQSDLGYTQNIHLPAYML